MKHQLVTLSLILAVFVLPVVVGTEPVVVGTIYDQTTYNRINFSTWNFSYSLNNYEITYDDFRKKYVLGIERSFIYPVQTVEDNYQVIRDTERIELNINDWLECSNGPLASVSQCADSTGLLDRYELEIQQKDERKRELLKSRQRSALGNFRSFILCNLFGQC